MPRAFNENELLERVDNDWDFLAETVEMLAKDGRELMAEIRNAAASGNAAAVARAAHTLKGMISNFCSPEAHAAALAVEHLGKRGDLAAVLPATETLDTHLNSLISDLADFVSTRA
jgi:HPt (histidine-containing phosphotransfer) domain-containing protein